MNLQNKQTTRKNMRKDKIDKLNAQRIYKSDNLTFQAFIDTNASDTEKVFQKNRMRTFLNFIENI